MVIDRCLSPLSCLVVCTRCLTIEFLIAVVCTCCRTNMSSPVVCLNMQIYNKMRVGYNIFSYLLRTFAIPINGKNGQTKNGGLSHFPVVRRGPCVRLRFFPERSLGYD